MLNTDFDNIGKCNLPLEDNSYVYIDNSNWQQWYTFIYKCLYNRHDGVSHEINRMFILIPMKDVPGVIGDTIICIVVSNLYELNKLFGSLFGEDFLDKVKEHKEKYKENYNNRCVKWKKLLDFDPSLSNKTKEELRELYWDSTPSVSEIG